MRKQIITSVIMMVFSSLAMASLEQDYAALKAEAERRINSIQLEAKSCVESNSDPKLKERCEVTRRTKMEMLRAMYVAKIDVIDAKYRDEQAKKKKLLKQRQIDAAKGVKPAQ